MLKEVLGLMNGEDRFEGPGPIGPVGTIKLWKANAMWYGKGSTVRIGNVHLGSRPRGCVGWSSGGRRAGHDGIGLSVAGSISDRLLAGRLGMPPPACGTVRPEHYRVLSPCAHFYV